MFAVYEYRNNTADVNDTRIISEDIVTGSRLQWPITAIIYGALRRVTLIVNNDREYSLDFIWF